MSRPPRPLEQIQRWMQAVIVHPEGVIAGIEAESAQREIVVPAGQVEAVVRRSRQQTSVERLQIYANAYYARLLECLREEFPALVHALGEETFDAFAFGYLQYYPSQSYTLADLGRHFPKYLEETRPLEIVGEEDGPSWPDFLIDLATVERTYSEVFDGPGTEGKPILQPGDLAGISPEKWSMARLQPVPCLRLMSLKYPVHLYISAVRKKGRVVIPEPSPTYLVVTRREYVVRRSAVSRMEYALLTELVAGKPIGPAIERVAAEPGVDNDALAGRLHEWFRDWAAAAYFRGIEIPS